MNNQTIFILMGITGGLFAFTMIAYFIMKKILAKSDIKQIKQLKEGTKEKKYTLDVLYQKLYVFLYQIPLVKRYLIKIRRKVEIINIDDEYLTRKQSAEIVSKALVLVLFLTLAIVFLVKDYLLLAILLLFELFLIEAIMEGMVDKLDTKLLKQQIDFFAEIRHAYHEYNMVEEAIYDVSQNDELEISRQGGKVYEILISDDPETELEKYYDVAPNIYLKEFAGISYLTREFGDRTDKNGASLYLKNLNNITEEMQLEILKREKLDYAFQSLSFITVIPVLLLQPLKSWAISNFSFTTKFYDGKFGFIAQILLVVITFLCYLLIRKLKDNVSTKQEVVDPNRTWQMKLYRFPVVKQIVDLFIPKEKTKEYRETIELMKEAASKQKMETYYVNRIAVCLVTFVATLIFCLIVHDVAVDYVYEQPTTDYNLLGELSEKDKTEALSLTEQDNFFLDKLKGKVKLKNKDKAIMQISETIRYTQYYEGAAEEEITVVAERLYEKLLVVDKEYLKWFEWLVASAFAALRILYA